MKTAIVIGATGLVGKALLRLLLNDSRFEKVKVLVRKSSGVQHTKLEEHIVDFDAPDKWKKIVSGDVLYSCMGTTLSTAGSKEAQYKVDYTYQFTTAKIAAANGVCRYVLISAAGADTKSNIFYSRMKGELERDIKKLPFECIHILRPGMLSGPRDEKRTGERIGIAVMNVIGLIPGLGGIKPITDIQVAKAMINATFRHVTGIHSYTLKEVFRLARLVESAVEKK